MIFKIKYYIFRFRDRMIRTPEKRAELYKSKVNIGEGCRIYSRVDFSSEPYLIKIGNNVMITSMVNFLTHDGGMGKCYTMGLSNKPYSKFGKIVVGDNVFIGIKTIIMPGVTIGNNCIIGAGSVVTKDIPSNTVAAGVPAKVISSIEEYYEKNKHKLDYIADMTYNQKKNYLINKFWKV